MTTKTGLLRGSMAAGLVGVLAAAYLAGSVRAPDTVEAATSRPREVGAVAQPDTISVGGVGKIAGTPDTLDLQLQVESRGGDVSKALDNASAALRRVSASLKSRGVVDADIQTSGLGVQANYNYDKGKQTLIDYVATESLSVKLRVLSKAGAAISAAVTAGGNEVRINGASLDLAGNSALVQQARAAAFADAKAKAEQYAKLAGRALVAVSTITENVSDSPPVPVMEGRPTADAAKSVPIEPGSQEVSVNVEVVWSIK